MRKQTWKRARELEKHSEYFVQEQQAFENHLGCASKN